MHCTNKRARGGGSVGANEIKVRDCDASRVFLWGRECRMRAAPASARARRSTGRWLAGGLGELAGAGQPGRGVVGAQPRRGEHATVRTLRPSTGGRRGGRTDAGGRGAVGQGAWRRVRGAEGGGRGGQCATGVSLSAARAVCARHGRLQRRPSGARLGPAVAPWRRCGAGGVAARAPARQRVTAPRCAKLTSDCGAHADPEDPCACCYTGVGRRSARARAEPQQRAGEVHRGTSREARGDRAPARA